MEKRNIAIALEIKGTNCNQNWYERHNFEVRPVTDEDKWCVRQKKFRVKPKTIAPYGYIVTITKWFDKMKLSLAGYVIKSRLKDGNLLLQISEGHPYERVDCKYVISLENREIPKNVKTKKRKKSDKTKKRKIKSIVRFLNIRRL